MTNFDKDSMVYDRETGEPLVYNQYQAFERHTLAADPRACSGVPTHAIHIQRPAELDDEMRYSQNNMTEKKLQLAIALLGREGTPPLVGLLEQEIGSTALRLLRED